MAKYSGKNLWIGFVTNSYGTAGTALGTAVISTNYRSLDAPHQLNNADATAGGDSYEVTVPTTKVISASVEFLADSTYAGTADSNIMKHLTLEREGTILWAPEGTSTGKPKWGFQARLDNVSQTHSHTDVTSYSLEFMNIGSDLVHNGATATW